MPPKPSTTKPPPPNPHFKPGTPVEISSDDPGFRGSWYTGTVIRRPSTKTPTKLLVEYSHLFADESGSKPLREVLETHNLRPIAPREKHRVFKFGEEVDAYQNDGWWEGSITKEMENGKFKVYFRRTREQIVFGPQDLRLHREWIHEKWDLPLEEDEKSPNLKPTVAETEEKLSKGTPVEKVPVRTEEKPGETNTEEMFSQGALVEKVPVTTEEKPGETKTEEMFSLGALVEVSSDEDGFHGAWFTATIMKAVGKDKFLVEYQNLKTDDDTEFLREEVDNLHVRPQPPEKIMVDNFNLLEEVDALYNDGWWVGVIAKVLSNSRYLVYFKDTKEEMEFRHSELRLHQEWIDSKWVMASQALKF